MGRKCFFFWDKILPPGLKLGVLPSESPMSLCVCVCVCLWQRERRERHQGWTGTRIHRTSDYVLCPYKNLLKIILGQDFAKLSQQRIHHAHLRTSQVDRTTDTDHQVTEGKVTAFWFVLPLQPYLKPVSEATLLGWAYILSSSRTSGCGLALLNLLIFTEIIKSSLIRLHNSEEISVLIYRVILVVTLSE